MESAAEAVELSRREMKEVAKETKVKAAAVKATVFLSLLVGVPTYRCTMF